MKNIFGTIGFFIVAMLTFRFFFGAWPPSEGDFSQWISSDPKALWSMVAAIFAGIVGAFIGRTFAKRSIGQKGMTGEAAELVRRGLRYHKQMKIIDAIDMFKRAIEVYKDSGHPDDVAPVYGLLGKAYFDSGDLDLAEETLSKAMKIYMRRPNSQEAIDTINALNDLISERKQNSHSTSTYNNKEYGFSFTIPESWLKQRLVQQFSDTGGQIAISHKSHNASFNVSAGNPERLEWVDKESRASAVRVFLDQTSGRIGAVAVTTSTTVGGQSNTVCAEYMVKQNIRGVSSNIRHGLISIINNGLEFSIQWTATREYEDEVNDIIASFRFSMHNKNKGSEFSTSDLGPSRAGSGHAKQLKFGGRATPRWKKGDVRYIFTFEEKKGSYYLIIAEFSTGCIALNFPLSKWPGAADTGSTPTLENRTISAGTWPRCARGCAASPPEPF